MKTVYEENNITLHCGDALHVLPALTTPVGFLLTDPPYSSGGLHSGTKKQPTKSKYISEPKKTNYADFDGDNRDQRSCQQWTAMWLSHVYALMENGGVAGVFTDWRQIAVVVDALQMAGFIYRGLVVWDKTASARPYRNGYQNQCEFVVWGTKGQVRKRKKEDDVYKRGYYRHRVDPAKKRHIAGKPVELIKDLLELAPPDAVVLDPFLGSGTTMEACRMLGLHGIGSDVSMECVNTTIERLKTQN
jgi:site-specific DNA-methyltransferase (adenine-specific)